jgi:diguanylate cyclase (GGDEF)-like protein
MLSYPSNDWTQILLVDDSATNLRMLGEILSPDYNILIATCGEEALSIAQGIDRPDLILLDVVMPGMDGYTVCRALKEDDSTRSIPVIFVTAVEGSEAEARGLDLGAVDYITKPFSAPVVRARVRTHVVLKQQTDLLEHLAFIDGLTGIANRRQFDQQLTREWARMLRENAPLSLLMIDVDHFKSYNDRYGHGAGDECLRRIGRTLADVPKRAGDLVARFGGDEFAVILPNTDAKGALVMARAILAAVNTLKLAPIGSPAADQVTLSLGAATGTPRAIGDIQAFIQAADLALYRAKTSGRNQICSEVLAAE